MQEGIYVMKSPSSEPLSDVYYELEPTPQPTTLLDKLRHWIHGLRDFIVTPPPPREQVHLLVAPSLATLVGSKSSP